MEMSKREYAEAIAREINGAKVVEVEKANGVVFTGITVKEEGSNVAPTFYVDPLYDKGTSVDDAIEISRNAFNASQKSINVDWISDWSQVKGKLAARLYNNATKADVFESAARYGFDDLIIIPYVTMTLDDGMASVKVTNQLLEQWGVSAEEVIFHAMENSRENFEIKSMMRTMAELNPQLAKMMFGDVELPKIDYHGPNVISNRERTFGAIAVIFAHDKLRDYYPNGYSVLPSSVHEVIVTPYEDDVDGISQMVKEVNATIDPTDVLSDMAYIFKF